MDEMAERRYQQDSIKARQNWKVTDGSALNDAVHVGAEASTGSRYSVVVTKMPASAALGEGGDYLVSVVQPWQTCYPVSGLHPLHEDYVRDRFRNPSRKPEEAHGGDMAAITLTINYAIGQFESWTAISANQ